MREKVSPETYRHVRDRDLWACIAPELPLAPGALTRCEGPIELDHVHNGGLGRRGPSTSDNLVSLCQRHHRIKTENARAWRPRLDWYLDHFEPARIRT